MTIKNLILNKVYMLGMQINSVSLPLINFCKFISGDK